MAATDALETELSNIWAAARANLIMKDAAFALAAD